MVWVACIGADGRVPAAACNRTGVVGGVSMLQACVYGSRAFLRQFHMLAMCQCSARRCLCVMDHLKCRDVKIQIWVNHVTVSSACVCCTSAAQG
jgi:hypothetical protein